MNKQEGKKMRFPKQIVVKQDQDGNETYLCAVPANELDTMLDAGDGFIVVGRYELKGTFKAKLEAKVARR